MNGDGGAANRTDTAICIAVAAGLLADSYLPFAWKGWFVTSPWGLLWPAAVALCLAAIVGLAATELKPWRTSTAALAGLAGGFVVTIAVLDLLPPVARDELTHHLAVPALFVRAGRIVPLPFADQAHYPMLITLLYTPLVAHGWESAAKLLHLGFGVAAAALLFLHLRRRTSAPIALFVAVLLLTTPTVAVLGASAYVDLGLLFFAAAAVVALVRWSESGRMAPFLLAALATGLAATVKYNGFLLLPLLGAAAVFLCAERRTPALLGWGAAFAAVSLLPLLPWLAKNLSETGNPVYPLLNSWLGSGPLPHQPSIDVFTYRRELYGESWPMALLAPLRVFLTGREGDPARFDGVFNPLYLAGFAAVWLPSKRRRAQVLAALAAILLFLVLFLAVFRSRYAIAALVPLALLTAAAFDWATRAGRAWRSLATAAAGAALAFNAAHLALFVLRLQPQAYLFGGESRQAYVARFVPEYPVTAWANTHLPTDATVYLAFLGQRGYYWERPYTYDFHLSGIALRDAVRGSATQGEIAAALRHAGISHIASADSLLERFMRTNLDDRERERWRRFTAENLRLLWSERGIGLYEVVAPGSA